MSTKQFQNKYRIDSARAMWHNYAGGAYFITVCTRNRQPFLGKIENGNDGGFVETRHATSLHDEQPIIRLTQIGQFLHDCLQNITAHHPYAEIPIFVVMPDHWHAIVFIDEQKIPYVRRKIANKHVVETWHAASLQREQMQNIANKQGWLSVVIGNIQSATTKFAHENHIDFAWQTRFHDRIIRDENAMYRIAKYITNNPSNP